MNDHKHEHGVFKPMRQRLDDTRNGVVWKLSVGQKETIDEVIEHTMEEGDIPTPMYVKTFVVTGEYDDGCLGEIFIIPPKEGSLMRGLLDGSATLMSMLLQYGVPLEVIIRKFINTRFGPSGMTNDPQIPMATSIFDLICRKLALRYLDDEALEELGVEDHEEKARQLVAEELCTEVQGEPDGEEHKRTEDTEPLEEGWSRVTEKDTWGREITCLVNEQATCFKGSPGTADFASAREGGDESGEREQGSGAPGEEAGKTEGQVSSRQA